MNVEELKREMEESKKVIRERKVNLPSVTMASLLGSLWEIGVLSQGTVGLLAKHFVPKICAYMFEKGVVDPNKDMIENLYSAFKEYAFKEGEVELEKKEGEVRVSITTSECKICPKGVGGAEIRGTACPVPYFVAYCLTLLTGELWKPEGRVTKEEGKCKAVVKRA